MLNYLNPIKSITLISNNNDKMNCLFIIVQVTKIINIYKFICDFYHNIYNYLNLEQ